MEMHIPNRISRSDLIGLDETIRLASVSARRAFDHNRLIIDQAVRTGREISKDESQRQLTQTPVLSPRYMADYVPLRCNVV